MNNILDGLQKLVENEKEHLELLKLLPDRIDVLNFLKTIEEHIVILENNYKSIKENYENMAMAKRKTI